MRTLACLLLFLPVSVYAQLKLQYKYKWWSFKSLEIQLQESDSIIASLITNPRRIFKEVAITKCDSTFIIIKYSRNITYTEYSKGKKNGLIIKMKGSQIFKIGTYLNDNTTGSWYYSRKGIPIDSIFSPQKINYCEDYYHYNSMGKISGHSIEFINGKRKCLYNYWGDTFIAVSSGDLYELKYFEFHTTLKTYDNGSTPFGLAWWPLYYLDLLKLEIQQDDLLKYRTWFKFL